MLYRELRRLIDEPTSPMAIGLNRRDAVAGFEFFVPMQELVTAMDIEPGRRAVVDLQACLRTLARVLLIAPSGGHGRMYGPPAEGFAIGSPKELSEYAGRRVDSDGLVVRLDVPGVMLVLWRLGLRQPEPSDLPSVDLESFDAAVPACAGARLLQSFERV